MKKVVYITAVRGDIGMGHLIRCLSMACMLSANITNEFIVETDKDDILELIRTRGFEVRQLFNGQSITEFTHVVPYLNDVSAVVTDFYALTESYQQKIKKLGIKLVCIDDLHSMHYYADVIFNSSNSVKASDYKKEAYTRLYLGSKYVLLRPCFLENGPELKLPVSTTSVFINMGGADEFNNSQKFLSAIIKIPFINKIHVVLGHLYSNLESISKAKGISDCEVHFYSGLNENQICDLLANVNVAICPASGMAIEVCASHTALITGYTADNQISNLNGLVNAGCAISLNNFNKLSEEDITQSLAQILTNGKQLKVMVTNQKNLIDKRSAERIKDIFANLWSV